MCPLPESCYETRNKIERVRTFAPKKTKIRRKMVSPERLLLRVYVETCSVCLRESPENVLCCFTDIRTT